MDGGSTNPLMTTAEVAALLRVKERKIYDLVAEGAIPHTKVTGKILFPRDLIEAWIRNATVGGEVLDHGHRPMIMAGSHDPLLEWALGASGCGIGPMFDGSMDGLRRFQSREALITGLHVPDGRGGYNRHLLAHPPHFDGIDTPAIHGLVLVRWARRTQGLIHARPGGTTDRPLAEWISEIPPGRLQRRQATAGSQMLFEFLLRDAGLDIASLPWAEAAARTETDAALSVMEGHSDLAFGVEAVAKRFSLGFQPLVREEYDLLLTQRDFFGAAFQALLAFSRTAVFAEKAADLGGYDTEGTGVIVATS